MKTHRLLRIFLGIAIIMLSSCATEEVVDPADQFVGTYSYVLKVTGALEGTQSGIFVVEKIAADKIKTTIEDGIPTYYTVVGNKITEDAGQYVYIPKSETEFVKFEENSTGTLVNGQLTIGGTWYNFSYPYCYINITAYLLNKEPVSK